MEGWVFAAGGLRPTVNGLHEEVVISWLRSQRHCPHTPPAPLRRTDAARGPAIAGEVTSGCVAGDLVPLGPGREGHLCNLVPAGLEPGVRILPNTWSPMSAPSSPVLTAYCTPGTPSPPTLPGTLPLGQPSAPNHDPKPPSSWPSGPRSRHTVLPAHPPQAPSPEPGVT